VYIKATEGGDFVDPSFVRNWEQSRKTGLLRGAYHFYTFCRAGAEQAQNFVQTVPIEPNTLPPVVDLEFGGNCSKRPYSSELIPEVQIFLNVVEKHTGQRPVLYVTDTFAKTHLNQGQLATYSLWVRDIVREPALFNGRPWLFWQFSNRGKVPGIQGRVDLNVFKGSPAELRRLFVALSTLQN
jgi:lysozyme